MTKIEMPDCLKNLSQDLRKITREQFVAWVRWFAETKKLEGRQSLREHQSLQNLQIASAYAQCLSTTDPVVRDRLERAMDNCNIILDVCSAAVSLQTFGEDGGWEAFIPKHLIGES